MKKLEKSDRVDDDDVYILYVNRYTIKTYDWLVRWCCTWWCVHVVCQETYIKEYLVDHLYIVKEDYRILVVSKSIIISIHYTTVFKSTILIFLWPTKFILYTYKISNWVD
jgi:hypothetical protein